MSIPFQLIIYDQAVAAFNRQRLPGRPPAAVRAFALRIRMKGEIRRELERAFGYTHGSLFPDLPGFAAFGRSWRS
jgi:hypothetical protein